MQHSILQNLIQIQKEAAPFSRSDGNIDDVFWVMNSAKYWPNYLVGKASNSQLPDILKKIERKNLPPFWIMQNDNSEDQAKFLESNGFREVNRWEGMWLRQPMFNETLNDLENFKLQNVNKPLFMKQWFEIIQPIMLPNKRVHKELLIHWLDKQNYILTMGIYNGEAVSAGMAFIEQGVAGIYFIATLPDYRGKGYASVLVSDLIDRCFSFGVEEVILHSSALAENMYRKMGFQGNGKISTFWKIGMF